MSLVIEENTVEFIKEWMSYNTLEYLSYHYPPIIDFILHDYAGGYVGGFVFFTILSMMLKFKILELKSNYDSEEYIQYSFEKKTIFYLIMFIYGEFFFHIYEVNIYKNVLIFVLLTILFTIFFLPQLVTVNSLPFLKQKVMVLRMLIAVYAIVSMYYIYQIIWLTFFTNSWMTNFINNL